MSIKHLKVAVLLQLVQLGHTKHCSIFKYIYFKNFERLLMQNDSDAVNFNSPNSPPVCSMLSEIAQYLKFFMLFPCVTVTMSAS